MHIHAGGHWQGMDSMKQKGKAEGEEGRRLWMKEEGEGEGEEGRDVDG